jgi:hypothetical protein
MRIKHRAMRRAVALLFVARNTIACVRPVYYSATQRGKPFQPCLGGRVRVMPLVAHGDLCLPRHTTVSIAAAPPPSTIGGVAVGRAERKK